MFGIGRLLKRWALYRKLSPAMSAVENVIKAIKKERRNMPTAVVEVKSPWGSKINWTAVAGAVVALVAAFGVDMSEQLRMSILTAIPIVGGALIWIFRTWFTKSLTKGSVQ